MTTGRCHHQDYLFDFFSREWPTNLEFATVNWISGLDPVYLNCVFPTYKLFQELSFELERMQRTLPLIVRSLKIDQFNY